MGIGWHTAMVFGGTAVGLWTFGLAAGLLLAATGGPGWLWPLILIVAGVGGSLGYALTKRIAARCPTCGGRAYYETGPRRGSHFPIRYRCSACGTVRLTRVSEGR